MKAIRWLRISVTAGKLDLEAASSETKCKSFCRTGTSRQHCWEWVSSLELLPWSMLTTEIMLEPFPLVLPLGNGHNCCLHCQNWQDGFYTLPASLHPASKPRSSVCVSFWAEPRSCDLASRKAGRKGSVPRVNSGPCISSRFIQGTLHM